MSTEKMKLGPIQEAWVKSLEDHPERQMKGFLGNLKADGSYQACCLGEAVCVLSRLNNLRLPFDEVGRLYSQNNFQDHKEIHELERRDWEYLGLLDGCGKFADWNSIDDTLSLAEMNDSGKTWPEIAEFIRDNPEKVFTKSV